MKKIKITCDSICDLGELYEKYDISALPLTITLDGEAHLDGVDITPDELYGFFDETGKLAKTTAANIADYTDFFEKFTDGETDIIHFCLSSQMSTTFNNARLAAEEFDNVYVIDTANLSTGSGLLVLKAVDLIKEGKSAPEIVEIIEKTKPLVDASFVINDLLYLKKGGRCSSLAALGANLLKLKPCIEVKDGAMGVGKKYRGNYATVLKEYVKDRLTDVDIDTTRVFVTHSGVDDSVCREVIELVKSTMHFDEVLFTRAGCTISAHCGPDTLGVLFIKK